MNIEDYLYIPYKDSGRTEEGCDCWGLVRLILHREIGLQLPDYSDQYASSTFYSQISKAIISNLETEWKKVDYPALFDILIYRRGKFNSHVCLYIGEKDRFIHCLEGVGTSVEKMSSPVWKNKFIGAFRHVSRNY